MKNTYQSLSHSKWDCKYHVVFVAKYRRKALLGNLRKQRGASLHELAQQKECQSLAGQLRPDHVHRCSAIPPQQAGAAVLGFIKGKRAISIARLPGKAQNFAGEPFWARGYAVSTVGFNEEEIRRYIRDQEGSDGSGRF